MTALGQGMSGVALILGFALLCSRRVILGLLWSGAQALSVSFAMAMDHDTRPALANALLSGLLVPVLLRRVCGSSEPESERNRLPVVLAAAGVLSLLATEAGALALPLAILLIGLLLVATRRDVSFQAFGLCSMQQAALLATGTGGQAPPLLSLMLVVPALPALAAAAMWLGREGQTNLP